MLPCVCSVIDRRGRQNVVRTYTLARQNLFVKLIKHDCVYDALENEDLCWLVSWSVIAYCSLICSRHVGSGALRSFA